MILFYKSLNLYTVHTICLILYDLLLSYPSKYYLLPVLKICEPSDLFLGLKHLMESKVWLDAASEMCVLHSIYLASWQSSQSPAYAPWLSTCSCPFVLLCQVTFAKEATGRSHHIYLMPHMLSYLLCVTFISFDLFIIS